MRSPSIPRGLALLAALSGCSANDRRVATYDVIAAPGPSAVRAASPSEAFTLTELWKQLLDPRDVPYVHALARAPSGDVALAVSLDTVLSITVFDPTGRVRWTTVIDQLGSGFLRFGGMGFDRASNLVLGGVFASVLRVSEKAVLEEPEAPFILSLDGEGTPRWAKAIQGDDLSTPTLRMGSHGGSILLAGTFGSTVSLGDTPLVGSGQSNGVSGSLYLSRLDLSGAVQWARAFPGKALVNDLTDDANGHAILSADYFGSFTVPGFPALELDDTQARGGLLLRADGAEQVRWLREGGARGIAAASDGSLFFCAGPWERFGQKRLGSIRPNGTSNLDKALGLLSCTGVAMSGSGRLLVVGGVQLGEPDPTTGGIRAAARVLDVTRDGDVISGVTLPLPSIGLSGVLVADGTSGALVAGAFVDGDRASLALYRLSR
ncbi:MAG: hypothetical protein U0414_43845 [Polyangiaceae bacterium]